MIFDEVHNANTKRARKPSNHIGHAPPPATGKQTKRKSGVKAPTGINLREVAEVLSSYGMDPTVEFVKVLQIEGSLEPEVRARMMLEIMQYVHPKLKSIEVKQDKPMQMVVRWATDGE